eukprot:g46107.t1
MLEDDAMYLERLNVHGEDEVLGAGELKILEKVESMGCVPKVDGEFLDERGKNGVKVGGDKLRGAGAGRDDGLEAVDRRSPEVMKFVDGLGDQRWGRDRADSWGELASGFSNVE